MSLDATMWEKADASYQNYLAYIARKTDRFELTPADLLYVTNFKGGNAAIHETEATIQDKLVVYAAAMKSLEATFGGRAISDLNKEELGVLKTRAQEFIMLSTRDPSAIDGFKCVYMAALLHFYFPRLTPILDKRVLAGLGLLVKYDRDRQVTDIWKHYSTLIEGFHVYLKLMPAKIISRRLEAGEGFPASAGFAESTLPPDRRSRFAKNVCDIYRCKSLARPRGFEDSNASIPFANADEISLRHPIIAGDRREPTKEFVRRDLIRRELRILGDLALGHAKSAIDDGRCVHLHRHRVGIGGVDSIQIQNHLQIVQHPFDRPSIPIQGQGFFGRKPLGIQYVCQNFEDLSSGQANADPPQSHNRSFGGESRHDQPFLDPHPISPTLPQSPLLPKVETALSSKHPKQVHAPQKLEKLGGAIISIRNDQRPGDQRAGGHSILQELFGSPNFACGRVSAKLQPPQNPSMQVVQCRDTARQNHRSLIPQDFQAVPDRLQSRPIQNHHRSESFQEARRIGRKGAPGHRQDRPDKPFQNSQEKIGPHGLAFLEKRLGRRFDARRQSPHAGGDLLKRLRQRLGSSDHHLRPEHHQRGQAPFAVSFRQPHFLKNCFAEFLRQMGCQKLQRRQQTCLSLREIALSFGSHPPHRSLPLVGNLSYSIS